MIISLSHGYERLNSGLKPYLSDKACFLGGHRMCFRFFVSFVIMACSYILLGCSTVAGNKKGLLPKESDILPYYASAYSQTESIPSVSLFTGNIEITNSSPIILDPQVDPLQNYLPHGVINLPILFGQPDNSREISLYPLLNKDIALIIPTSTYSLDINKPDISQVRVTFVLSDYNLRTMQPDNLESALRNSALLVNWSQLFGSNHNDKIKTRLEYLEVSKAALKTLYTKDPELKAKFESAAGFGVFQINNYNVLLYVGAYGKGVIFDNKNKKVIYMYTSRAGTGPGVGYESMYVIFVFKNDFALQQFIGAKGSGADIGASATLGVMGGQVSFNPEISVYQIHKNGFDLQANWGGTLYFPAYGLN